MYFTCRPVWEFYFKQVLGEPLNNSTTEIVSLPSVKKFGIAHFLFKRNNRPRFCPATFRIERISDDQEKYVWCTSPAFDPFDLKDDLVHAIQVAGCTHLAPDSYLLEWDISDLTPEIKQLFHNQNEPLLLKSAIGSGGRGIEFVCSSDELFQIIQQNAEAAKAEPNFLDQIRKTYQNRIPSWVLQRHIKSILVQGGRKCHLRAYIVIHDKILMYKTIEVRVAASIYCHESNLDWKDRSAHITNGAGGDKTERFLLSEIDELSGLEFNVQDFLVELLNSLKAQICETILNVSEEENNARGGKYVEKFGVAGVDIMVDENKRLWLLEFNRNPAAPPPGVLSDTFRNHLIEFTRSICNFALNDKETNFHDLGISVK